ncbi:hypothetical protein EDC94DRAFT_516777, partial [Helicostylum pulchrum]
QNNLVILKSYPAVYTFLVDALKVPIDNLPNWLWNYTCPENSTAREKELILAVKYTLTDFAGKCNIKRPRQTNSERTFWMILYIPRYTKKCLAENDG